MDDAQQTEMKNSIALLRSDYDSLNLVITNTLSTMKAAVQRWDLYHETIGDISTWLNDTESNSTEIPDSR